jgi:uncharacterized protein involved in exopolysaccharide biosynthesis
VPARGDDPAAPASVSAPAAPSRRQPSARFSGLNGISTDPERDAAAQEQSIAGVVGKVLEQLFAHKLLILTPLIVIPLVAGVVSLQTPPIYESTASIWVERPTYVVPDDLERYTPPATVQARRLKELLKTAAFTDDVESRAPIARSPVSRDEQKALEAAVSSIDVTAGGDHLLLLSSSATMPTPAFAALSGLIDAYKLRSAEETIKQSALAVDFYTARLGEAQAKLAKSNDNLRTYIAEHPKVATQTGGAPTAAELELAQLQRQYDLDRSDVERINAAIAQSQRNGVAARSGAEVGFQVVDQPQVPTSARRELKKLLLLPALGAAAGSILAGTLLTLFVALDRTARSSSDLSGIGPVLGALPRFGGPAAKAEGVRRVTGFPAGARRSAPSPNAGAPG